MVELPKVIVVINKSLIRVAQVVGTELQDPIEMEWNSELLRKGFAVIKSRYQTARIRLVLDDELSHTLDLSIPSLTSEGEERALVESKLKEQIPEVLTAGNWDYKVKTVTAAEKLVTVFVPVQDSFLQITDAANKEGLEIEAVEPISISLTRDPNPFIGMALKTDLRGDDAEVLNIQPIFEPAETTGSLTTDSLESALPLSEEKKPINKFLLIGAGVLVVGLLAFGIVRAVGVKKPAASPSPTPVVVMETPTPSPTPAPVVLSDLKLEVLNGTGVPGQAGVVGKLLQGAGFAEPKTGNADKYGYKETVVQLKSTLPDSVMSSITSVLEPNYTVKTGDPLESTSEFDVIVTVGTSKSQPSATPKASVKPSPSPSPKVSGSPSPSASGSPKPSTSASPSPSSSGSASPSPSASGSPTT